VFAFKPLALPNSAPLPPLPRYIYSDYYAKKERREAERDRIRAEKEAALAKLEADRLELAAFDAAQEAKIAARSEDTGLATTVL